MATIKAIVLAKRPKDRIVPGETFRTETRPAPREEELKDGEVIFEVIYLSLDPAMRPQLNDVRGYVPPVGVGEIMRGSSIGVIKASRSARFPTGSVASSPMMGPPGWSEQAVLHEKKLGAVEVPKGARLVDALSIFGGTGMTAYHGIIDVGKVKAGDFVVVSGAAGATGSIVCQIAKIKGARVLAIAGSDEKVRWLKEEIGCDDAVNYKAADFAAQFRTKTKGFYDIFFDNVGGEVLNLALSRAKTHARIVMCGGISQYNVDPRDVKGPSNYLSIVSQRLSVQGFLVLDYVDQWPRARQEMARWMAEGKLKSTETIVKGGLSKAEEALAGLFEGRNTGKMMVEVKPPPNASPRPNL